MPNLTTTYAFGEAICTAIYAVGPRIELTSVLSEPSGTYAVFTIGQANHIVRVGAEELITFDAFRRRVRESLSIEVGPPRISWDAAVRDAAKRGEA